MNIKEFLAAWRAIYEEHWNTCVKEECAICCRVKPSEESQDETN